MSVGPAELAVEVFTSSTDAERWDYSTWGSGEWSAPAAWQPVTCDVLAAAWGWGARSRSLGVLSVAETASLDLTLLDPLGELDPANPGSARWPATRIGTPWRLLWATAPGAPMQLARGRLDTIEHRRMQGETTVRAIDFLGQLAQVDVPSGTVLPNTLGARVAAILAAILIVDPPAVVVPTPDPEVAAVTLTSDANALQLVNDAALDALVFGHYWPPTHQLRFPRFGDPVDAATLDVGCEGIVGRELASSMSPDSITNLVRAANLTGVVTTATGTNSRDRYGVRVLDRTARRLSTAPAWADLVLQDRVDGSLDIVPTGLLPADLVELGALVATPALAPVRVHLDELPLIDVEGSLLGARYVCARALQADVRLWLPVAGWAGLQPPVPPEPPEPPTTPDTERVTLTYNATADAGIASTGGSKWGAGARDTLPLGPWSGWTYKSLIAFAPIDWSRVVRVVSATVKLTTTTRVDVDFGSSPRITIRRCTSSWSEGSGTVYGSNGGGVVWPGPTVTSTGEVSVTHGHSAEGAVLQPKITTIVRAWAPVAVEGGGGAAQRGIMLIATDSSDTSEVWAREHGSATRATLSVVVDRTLP